MTDRDNNTIVDSGEAFKLLKLIDHRHEQRRWTRARLSLAARQEN